MKKKGWSVYGTEFSSISAETAKKRIGNDSIFISPRGDVSAGSCGVSDIFSNINTWKVEDLNHIGSPVICPKNHCTCGTDVIIPKTRKNYSNIFS